MSGQRTTHVVQFSTGAGSAEVAFRLVERYGPERVVLLTADTLVEDEDNWRFAREVVAQLGPHPHRLVAPACARRGYASEYRVTPGGQVFYRITDAGRAVIA